jgi:hypothetical protein
MTVSADPVGPTGIDGYEEEIHVFGLERPLGPRQENNTYRNGYRHDH